MATVLDDIEQYLQNNTYIDSYTRINSSQYCAVFNFIVNPYAGIPVDIWYVNSTVETRTWLKTYTRIMDIGNMWKEFYDGLFSFRDRAEISFISYPEETRYVYMYTMNTKITLLKENKTGVFKACSREYFQHL